MLSPRGGYVPTHALAPPDMRFFKKREISALKDWQCIGSSLGGGADVHG